MRLGINLHNKESTSFIQSLLLLFCVTGAGTGKRKADKPLQNTQHSAAKHGRGTEQNTRSVGSQHNIMPISLGHGFQNVNFPRRSVSETSVHSSGGISPDMFNQDDPPIPPAQPPPTQPPPASQNQSNGTGINGVTPAASGTTQLPPAAPGNNSVLPAASGPVNIMTNVSGLGSNLAHSAPGTSTVVNHLATNRADAFDYEQRKSV